MRLRRNRLRNGGPGANYDSAIYASVEGMDMRRMTSSTVFKALLAAALLSAPLLAANYQTGVIDDVHKKEHAIVVDDSWYRLSPNVRVHGLVGSPDDELKRNMKIGFTTQQSGNKLVITEIWVLPDNFVLPEK